MSESAAVRAWNTGQRPEPSRAASTRLCGRSSTRNRAVGELSGGLGDRSVASEGRLLIVAVRRHLGALIVYAGGRVLLPVHVCRLVRKTLAAPFTRSCRCCYQCTCADGSARRWRLLPLSNMSPVR